MKVAELEGAKLDYWTAKALGAEDVRIEEWGGLGEVCVTAHRAFEPVPFLPSTKWADGGPIIERIGISISRIAIRDRPVIWQADFDYRYERGEAPLVAATRCFVSSKYGEEVE